jgi:hypothetical protein
MNTEVSIRKRRTRGSGSSRAGLPGAARTSVAPARGDQSVTRQAGPAGPLLRPPGTSQPARRRPGATRPGVTRPDTRPPGTPQPGAVPAAGRALPAAAHVPRTRFVLLLLGLLGGGLVCLLVINTTLAAASFRISALQQGNVALARQEQTLQQQVTTEESPASLERRARKLGMRPQPRMNFINLRTGRVYRAPSTLPGVPNVPGYAP